MRKQFLTLLLLAGQLAAFADGSALLITMKNGNTAGYVLSDKPTVTFGDGTLIVKAKEVSTEYQRADISKFSFVDAGEISGIQALPQGSTVFDYRNGILRAEGSTIQVYTLDGKLVNSGSNTISLTEQPAGVYVVKMGKQVIKVKR